MSKNFHRDTRSVAFCRASPDGVTARGWTPIPAAPLLWRSGGGGRRHSINSLHERSNSPRAVEKGISSIGNPLHLASEFFAHGAGERKRDTKDAFDGSRRTITHFRR